MDAFPVYRPVSSNQAGALALYHVHADEAVLAARLDRDVRMKKDRDGKPLEMNELRYGWLYASSGLVLDEVMVARPADRMRVLMTHGGRAVREAVTGHLRERGFMEGGGGEAYADAVCDPLLASCVTEAQAAAVLDARLRGYPVPEGALATRRVVLAGAPNAGKSSLFNQLAGYDRAFVHEEAGATRDVVDELVDLGGYAVLLGDLPGYAREEEGVGKAAWDWAARRMRDAACVLFVADASSAWEGGTAHAAEEAARILGGAGEGRVLVVLNKADLPERIGAEAWTAWFPGAEAVRVSSLEGRGARGIVEQALARLWRRKVFLSTDTNARISGT